MSADPIVIGMDAGGTKTLAAAVTSRGETLLEQTGPSVSTSLRTPEQCWEQLRKLAVDIQAELPADTDVAGVYAGVAGAASESIRQQLVEAARHHPLPDGFPQPAFDSDCRIALEGAIPDGPGVLVIAGTGSSAYGRDGRGREDLYGGWGHLVGDEGSGYWIGMEAIRACVRAEEGRGTETALVDAIQNTWSIGNMRAAIPIVYGPDFKSRIGALAPVVVEAARGGDEVAVEIIVRAAGALVELVQVAAGDLGLHDSAFQVATAGSLWRTGELLTGPFEAGIRQCCVAARHVPARYAPVLGAARLGFRQAGFSCHWE